MDFCNVPWDLGSLGLSSPLFNENALDFNSPSIQSSFAGLEELNANHEKTCVFADWMDEKMDLSILDGLEGQPDVLDDLEVMIGDSATLLDNLIDWSSELLRNENDTTDGKKGDLLDQDILQVVGLSPPVSPGTNKVPDISFGMLPEFRQESFYQQTSNTISSSNTITLTPDVKFEETNDLIPSEYVKVEFGSSDTELDNLPPSTPPLTPASFVSSANKYLTVESCSSVNTVVNSCMSSTPPLSPASFVSSVEYIGAENSMDVETSVSIEMPHSLSSFVLDSSFDNKSDDNESLESSISGKCNSSSTLSIEIRAEVTSDVLVKKCRSRKKAVPTFASPVPVEVRRKERKRVQNKDAATRYREKRRKESMAVMDEELTLEKRNKELHNTVDKLSSEISYLKGLLKEAKLRAQSRQKMSSTFNSLVKV